MSTDNQTLLAEAAQALNIFGGALVGFGIAFVLKVIIKRPVLKEHEEKEKWDEAVFDICRIGNDLALVGLSTYCAIFEMAQERAGGVPEYLNKLNTLLLLSQILILLVVTAMMSFCDEPKTPWSWFWGAGAPLVVGGFSVLLSMCTWLAIYVG